MSRAALRLGASTVVIMGGPLGPAGEHRQDRHSRSTVWIGTSHRRKDDGALERVEIQPDNVAYLREQLRALGELPLFWRSGCTRTPTRCDHTADWLRSDLGDHRPRRPVRHVVGRGSASDAHLLDLLTGDAAAEAMMSASCDAIPLGEK